WFPTKKWIRTWIQSALILLPHLGYTPGELIIKKRGIRGVHIWWEVGKSTPFTEDEVNMLQWHILHDDVTRCRINRMRTRRGMKGMWNKIFDHTIWKKELPQNCQKCYLLKTVRELEAEVLKPEGEYPAVVYFVPGKDTPNSVKILLNPKAAEPIVTT
ncbi:MAG: hypothetical protein WC325_12795, partial [Candidatus Bathyarchaeia archaeon]